MTFNIRREIPDTDRAADEWSRRAPAVVSLLQTEHPTIVGVQEAMPAQMRYLDEGLGAQWASVGHGRDADGDDEACPIYYNNERVELERWEQLALSDDPHEPGSRSWGNEVPRVLVAATFTDRATGRQVCVVNTHFDHECRRARRRSAKLIRHLLDGRDTPAVVMGDLNAGKRSQAVATLTEGAGLRDAWQVADQRVTPAWGTFPDYEAPKVGGKRIDWIMVSDGVNVLEAGINAHPVDGVWPSDHAPLQALVELSR